MTRLSRQRRLREGEAVAPADRHHASEPTPTSAQAAAHDERVLGLDHSWVRGRAVLEPLCHLFAGFGAEPSLEVGAFTYSHSHITPHVAAIGRYCSIAEGVQFGHEEHPTSWLSTSSFTYDPEFMRAPPQGPAASRYRAHPRPGPQRRITIGHDVWIGFGVYIRRGVTLGDGCIVGARAVVTRDVPPFAIVAGVPARVVRYRFDDSTIAAIRELAWWRLAFTDMEDVDTTLPIAALARIRRLEAEGVRPYEIKPLVLEGEGQALTMTRTASAAT